MSLLDPNLVRDSFWISSLNKMFGALKEQDDPNPVEFAGDDYFILGLSDEVLMVVKLPENYAQMSVEEVEQFMTKLYNDNATRPTE